MKKILIRIGLFTGTLAFLGWVIPVVIGMIQAKPFVGSFQTARCACGHDVFYLIEDAEAFEYCPGHKEKRLVGPALKIGNRVEVSDAAKLTPVFQLKFEDGDYFLKFTSVEYDWHVVDQVTNPWRTSLRWYLPE